MLNLLDLWVIAVILLILIGVKWNRFNKDYLSSAYTKGIRGLLAVCVVLCHITQKTNGGIAYKLAFTYAGSLCVGLFFFLSGFGCMTQYKKHGQDYLAGFIPKRLISVWVPLLVVSAFLYLEKIILGEPVSLSLLWKSITSGEYFVPYSGFVVTLSFFYILFYLGAKSDCRKVLKHDGELINCCDETISSIGGGAALLMDYSDSRISALDCTMFAPWIV